MAVEKGPLIFYLLATLLLSSSPVLISSQDQKYISSANLSTSWINRPSRIDNGIEVYTSWSPVLLRESDGGRKKFGCSFYCRNTNNECVFGVLIFPSVVNFTRYNYYASPELVWSANRNNPVGVNASLQLRQDGDLVLANPDGTLVWSTDTGGKSVAGFNLTEQGNLVLFGRNNEHIWQSFDHPTDSLLLGQKLVAGQKLTANVSESKFNTGLYSLAVDKGRLIAYVESNPPQIYYASVLNGLPYVEFKNGSFNGSAIPSGSVDQFLKLGFDGHLKVYQSTGSIYQFTGSFWTETADLFDKKLGNCGEPLVCGNYGVCSNGFCRCPDTETTGQGSFFRQVDNWEPNLGCSLITPISCNLSKKHSLLELNNTTYFAFEASFVNMSVGKSVEDCKSMCLGNCSCKAALFVLDSWGGTLGRKGGCLLLNEVFSIIDKENNTGAASNYNTTFFLKVQKSQAMSSRKKKDIIIAVSAAIGAFAGLFSVIAYSLVHCRKRSKKSEEIERGFLERVPGMPTAFSYEDLKTTTSDFSKKLGAGGFGSVYEGLLDSGTKIAVKRLDGFSDVNESFLVEAETIGSVHHVNLVKLIGFCFEKSHRLLVYEHMANGSLDRWIFDNDPSHSIPWNTRTQIIMDIAKGLAYLHEECSLKIIHFDIKPQNILLDEDFNAKVSDFGLSKLIEKDQSAVVTRMRGTPGYLAPEWLHSVITEKVDVYSFGILVLEIICGRKNLDWSRDEEDRHLLELFKKKAEDGALRELVDGKSEDMLLHVEEAEEMLKIAARCLQHDSTMRPSMSQVVKALEVFVASGTNRELNYSYSSVDDGQKASDSSLIMPSLLSGPR